MDDLLIVRLSDRSRARYRHRHTPTPLGANFGIIIGALAGFLVAVRLFPANPTAPIIGLALGLAVGIAIGGVLGQFLKPRSRRRTKRRPDLYDGLPFSDEPETKTEEFEDSEDR